MGKLFSRFAKKEIKEKPEEIPDFEIRVKTGDVKNAGANCDVFCRLIDTDGNKSKDLPLNCKWRNDFEKGDEDTFSEDNVGKIGNVECFELWRNQDGLFDQWFVEYVTVRNKNDGNDAIFPINRWIKHDKTYTFYLYDSVLPQLDKNASQRQEELAEKQSTYAYEDEITGLPRRIKTCPECESFSSDYKWDLGTRKVALIAEKAKQSIFNDDNWTDLDHLRDVYEGKFALPYGAENWESDDEFGQQRLTGCNPTLIKLCTALPPNFAVTSEMVEPKLEGLTLGEAMEKKQIYIVDLGVLENVSCTDDRILCSPFALFYRQNTGQLIPIAIQLFQQPAENNPVFLPSDSYYTWMLAKMYYNNADCALHQACTHLGFTHLVCESICIAVHQCLAPSHPIFRLLAPHFLFLLAINDRAVRMLLAEGGWIDVTMTMGTKGLLEIVKRRWKTWQMDVQGWLPEDLKNRGVDDREALPNYYYRDDAELLHKAIYDYVNEIISDVYDTPEKLVQDNEVQKWAAVLSDPVDGAGVKGVFGGGKFEVLDDLVKTITATIFISSVQHAAANFCQYDEYAFPPNYPATMYGEMLRDKEPREEKDILAALPNKETTLSIMVVTHLLSERATKPLGDFEMQYQYAPKTVSAVDKFKVALLDISRQIKERNAGLKQPYPYLNPTEVPNAISI